MKEVPPRQEKPEQTEFVRKRIQRMPASVTLGYNPLYAARQQLKKYAPDADFSKDNAAEEDGVFDHYLVPREAHERMQAGLAKEANDRLLRPDPSGLTSRKDNLMVAPEDRVTEQKQTLDQLGASLPSG